MDIYTLSVYTTALAWTVGVGLHLCYFYLVHTPVAGVPCIANSFILFGLSIFPLSLGFTQLDTLAILFSNSAYLLAFCLLLIGIIKFRGSAESLNLVAIIVGVASFLSFVYYSVYEPSIEIRIEVRSLLVIGVSLAAIWANTHGRHQDGRVAIHFLTLSLTINVIYMTLRCWYAYSDGPIADYFAISEIHKLSFLVMAITMMMSTFAIVWMLISRALEMSHLASITDELTGLYNRKGLREYYPQIADTDSQQPIGVLIADLDHFKVINDKFGHDIGDQVLKHFAKRLLATGVEGSLSIRYGGEEFMLIMPNTPVQRAQQVAEQIRQQVKLYSRMDECLLRYTASFGVTELLPKDSLSEAIKRADDALYQAKEKGRDQVVCGLQLDRPPSDFAAGSLSITGE
ncbi:hypothetical protein AKJ18_16675 [Vibrio xuii]|nr:hypothetical protein AKJ18_16675 [Vibrio xuii]